MHIKIEYLKDKKGRRNRVAMPVKQWKAFEADFIRTKNKLRVLTGIRNSLQEVKDIENGKKEGKTLEEVIREL